MLRSTNIIALVFMVVSVFFAPANFLNKSDAGLRPIAGRKQAITGSASQNAGHRVKIEAAYFRSPEMPPIAYVHEEHFVENQCVRIEKRRTVEKLNKNHPVWVEVYFSFEQQKDVVRQSFNLRDNMIVPQVPRICRYNVPGLCDFRSSTPFFGPFTPAAESFEDLVGKLHEIGSLANPNEETESYVLSGSVDNVGHFAIHFPSRQLSDPSRFVRTMKAGDMITKRRKLGFVDDKPDKRARGIESETDEWYDLVYDNSKGQTRIVSATRLLTTNRRDGTRDRHYAKIKFTYPKAGDFSKTLTWEDPFLKVKNGVPVECHPPDHRRFEFIDNRIVMVVDESAMNEVSAATFVSDSTSAIRQIVLVGLAILVIGVIFCTIRLSRRLPK